MSRAAETEKPRDEEQQRKRTISSAAIAERCYAILLLLYPRTFRRRFGPTMTEVFRTQWERQTRLHGARSWGAIVARTAMDFLRTAPRQWLRLGLDHLRRWAPGGRSLRRWRHGAGVRGLLGSVFQDVRFGLRTLRRRPLFTGVAVTTLGLGIGAATAMFSVVDGVLLQRLPYRDPGRLVNVWQVFPSWRGHPALGDHWDEGKLTFPEYRALREDNTVFDDIAMYNAAELTLTGHGAPRVLAVGVGSASLLSVLGVQPALGRWFLPADEGAARGLGAKVVVLSHEMWQGAFLGDREVLGTTVTLHDSPYTIIGVLPPGFHLRQFTPAMGGTQDNSGKRDVWVPIGQPTDNLERSNHHWETIGRLLPGVSAERAVGVITPIVDNADPNRNHGGMRVVQRRDQEMRSLASPLLLLLGATALLLLIACGNIATLSLGEMHGRRHEIATRSALGAKRSRVFRLLLTESVVLGLIGSAVGVVVALLGTRVLVALAPPIPRIDEVGVDMRVLVFATVVGMLAGVLFGTIPSLVFAGHSAVTLRGSGRGSKDRGRGVQRAVVSLEIALTVVVLVASGLLTRSLSQLFAVDPGFEPANLATVTVAPSEVRYRTPGERIAFHQTVLAELRAMPGVIGASAGGDLPFPGSIITQGMHVEGSGSTPDAQFEGPAYYVMSEFHEVMGYTMLAGRTFTAADGAGAPRVVVINETVARRYWPDASPIGARILRFGRTPFTVVGIVGDAKRQALGSPAEPAVYFPVAQGGSGRTMSYVARVDRNPEAMIARMREAVWAVDADAPVTDATTMTAIVAASASNERYRTMLMTVFGVLAAVLAAVGIFGVTARGVAQRTRELGIRLALGARQQRLVRSVLGGSVATGLVGMAFGILAALWTSRLLSRFLFGVDARDPLTYGVVASLLIVVCFFASYVPARRIARVDPTEVLRVE